MRMLFPDIPVKRLPVAVDDPAAADYDVLLFQRHDEMGAHTGLLGPEFTFKSYRPTQQAGY